jgi:hypothetical protein
MGLGAFAPVLHRVQELRVHSRQAGQVLGIYFICLAFVGVDEPQLACVGPEDLVATFLQEPANPRRMGSCFYGDAHGLLGGEASPQGFGGGTQSRPSSIISPLC